VRDPLFRLVCTPAAIADAADGWVTRLLESGELGLIADGGGLGALTGAARALDLVAVPLVRTEPDPAEQDQTVMTYADGRALVWIAPAFGEVARRWARERGPMTLLVESDGAVSDEDRHRIERFAAVLDRQAE
jgi:hypothetical protein